MKNFFFLSFFFFFFSLANSIFAQEIYQQKFAAVLVPVKGGGGEVVINVENLFDCWTGSKSKFKASFLKDSTVKTKIFDCSNFGKNVIEFWYTSGGKKLPFYSLVDIQDNKNLCPQKQKEILFLSGSIQTQSGKPVDADVHLVRYDIEQPKWVENSKDGKFFFDGLDQEFYGLEVRNVGIGNPAQGLTMADVVAIQRHILDIKRFTSPYQYLVADVNGDKKISSADITLIKKMILGTISWWPGNVKTWQFIPKDHVFINNTVPWNSMPQQKISVPLAKSMACDYIALKTGDVNDSNQGNLLDQELQSRSSSEEIALEDEFLRNQELIEEMEKRPQKEVMIYELNFLNSSGIQGWKKIK